MFMKAITLSYRHMREIKMSTDATYKTIAFGPVGDIIQIGSIVLDASCFSELSLSSDRTQWNGCFYATFEQRVPERFEFDFWERIIPQFPNLRFLQSKTSEGEWYRTQVVRHRHTPFGYNLCLIDCTWPQSFGDFPQNKNPISVLKDFHEEVLDDSELRFALKLLGYPHEMLVGCVDDDEIEPDKSTNDALS